MLDAIDAEVNAWLKDVVGKAEISFSRPSDDADKLVLFVYLFDIERPEAVPSGRMPPQQLRLSYLVTSSGPDPIAAHALLGDAIAAAGAQTKYVIEFGPPTAKAWSSINLPARPSFVLRATATQPRDVKPAPPVSVSVLRTAPLEPLAGRVVAADGCPLSGAVVEVPGLGRKTTANLDGRFVLEGVTNSIDLALRASAKGHEVEVRRSAHDPSDLTIVIDVTGA